jgi:hypothetical protein
MKAKTLTCSGLFTLQMNQWISASHHKKHPSPGAQAMDAAFGIGSALPVFQITTMVQ